LNGIKSDKLKVLTIIVVCGITFFTVCVLKGHNNMLIPAVGTFLGTVGGFVVGRKTG